MDKKSKSCILLRLFAIFAFLTSNVFGASEWEEYSFYHFDNGAELTDSGPAGNDLTTVGTPDEISGYSGNAFSFLSTCMDCDGAGLTARGEGLYASGFNLDPNVGGFRVSLWFKAGMDQIGAPRLITSGPSADGTVYGNEPLLIYSYSDYGFIAFNAYGPPVSLGATTNVTAIAYEEAGFYDDEWHYLVAEYDPNTKEMSIQVDSNAKVSKSIETNGIYPWRGELYIGTGGPGVEYAGLNGEIDEVKIEKVVGPDVTVTVGSNLSGVTEVTPAVGSHSYEYGLRIDLSAADHLVCPDTFAFDYWDGKSPEGDFLITSGNKIVTAVYSTSPTRECGDGCHATLASDLNHDCFTDFGDYAIFAADWLECTAPVCN